MQPNPQAIPTPIPKTDSLSARVIRQPLRRWLLRAVGVSLSLRGRGARVEGQPPKKILLIRPDHLGDLLFVTPALKFVREQLPHAHITLLVGPWAMPVVSHNPHVDAIQTLEFPGFTRRAKSSPLAPYMMLRNAAQQLRVQQFDAVVILRFDHWWGALLAALALIPRRIGYDVPEVKPFLTDVVRYEPGRHEVAQNIRLIARLVHTSEPMVTPKSFPLEFPTTPEEDDAAQRFLLAHAIAEHERFAIIVPGSGALVKLWRAEGWARVAEDLYERDNMRVMLIGAAGSERALIENIVAQSHAPIVNAFGQTALAHLAALFKRASLAIGTDSGPMHLAVAMGTPSVHLFGPVSARAFGPWGDSSRHVVLTSGLVCIPCNRLDYTRAEVPVHPCVRLIAERQVLAAAESVLSAES